jgi:hypothetical protein
MAIKVFSCSVLSTYSIADWFYSNYFITSSISSVLKNIFGLI